ERLAVSLPDTIQSASGDDLLPHHFAFYAEALGCSNFSFGNSGQSLGTFDTRDVALGDLDGDGDLDAFTVQFSGANRVWTNNGSGQFFDSGQMLTTVQGLGVALGDVDRDGDLDAVVAFSGGQANRVFTNNGSAVFTDSGQMLGSSTSSDAALGDFDGDGDLDVIFANWLGGINRVYTNNGAGVFGDTGQNLGHLESRGVAVGDVDNDGDLDLVFANTAVGNNRVFINDGNGIFADSGQLITGQNGQRVALGDFNEDGFLDAVFANTFGQLNRVFINDGAGNFSGPGQAFSPNRGNDVSVGDVDGDGDLDLAFAAAFTGGTEIYVNDGAGSFSLAEKSNSVFQSSAARLGDLDGDGDLDLYVGNLSTDPNEVLFNQGCGSDIAISKTVSSTNPVVTGSATYTFAVTNMGDLLANDVVVTDAVPTALIYVGDNSSDCVFTHVGLVCSFGTMAPGAGTSVIMNVMLAGNGFVTNTAVVASSSPDTNLLNNTNSAVLVIAPFSVTNTMPANSSNHVDRSASLDLFFNLDVDPATATGDAIRLYGEFQDVLDRTVAVSSNRVSLDPGVTFRPGERIVVSVPNSVQSTGGASLAPYQFEFVASSLGCDSFTFANSGQSLGTFDTRDVALGDLDGDGDLDAFTVQFSGANRVWLNDGFGQFADSGQMLTTVQGLGVALGDVDG
ncbi:MAG: FG-GAP-like repeat-containing protein, partial [Verrucomicrobiota bacterium]